MRFYMPHNHYYEIHLSEYKRLSLRQLKWYTVCQNDMQCVRSGWCNSLNASFHLQNAAIQIKHVSGHYHDMRSALSAHNGALWIQTHAYWCIQINHHQCSVRVHVHSHTWRTGSQTWPNISQTVSSFQRGSSVHVKPVICAELSRLS